MRRGITGENTVTERITLAMEKEAAKRAKVRAASARWDLNVAILLIAVLVSVIILDRMEIATEIIGLVAIVGLSMAWFIGWRRGRRLYYDFYDEELFNLEQNLIRWGMISRREHPRGGDSEDTA
ncbi:hypothetical protein ACFLXT_01700 [Chloroflexota bacterium]